MAKGKSRSMSAPPAQNKAGKKMADNVSKPMPGGTPDTPGPINDPANHPSNNLPAPQEQYSGDTLDAMAQKMGIGI